MKPKKSKKRINRQDLTGRNNRARIKDIKALRKEIAKLKCMIRILDTDKRIKTLLSAIRNKTL